MKKPPTLLLINGPAGIGKSTIAQKYIDNHRLALLIDIDLILTSMGQWIKNEDKARILAFKIAKSITITQLREGYDVVVPQLITNIEDVTSFENTAKSCNANFLEVALVTNKVEAISRLLKRGTWGEPQSPPITSSDIPHIEKLFDDFQKLINSRPETMHIKVIEDNINETYNNLIEAIKLNN